jgi:hypothetical protein
MTLSGSPQIALRVLAETKRKGEYDGVLMQEFDPKRPCLFNG